MNANDNIFHIDKAMHADQAVADFLKGIPSGIREFWDFLLKKSFSGIQEILEDLEGISMKLNQSATILAEDTL